MVVIRRHNPSFGATIHRKNYGYDKCHPKRQILVIEGHVENLQKVAARSLSQGRLGKECFYITARSQSNSLLGPVKSPTEPTLLQ